MAPLTEREKSQLRLLETQLHTEDPKFVKRMRTKHSLSVWQRPQARRNLLTTIGLVIGIVGFIGAILLTPIVGVNTSAMIVTGSMVLVLSILIASWDDISAIRKAKTQRFMASLEVKWDERKRDERRSR